MPTTDRQLDRERLDVSHERRRAREAASEFFTFGNWHARKFPGEAVPDTHSETYDERRRQWGRWLKFGTATAEAEAVARTEAAT